MDLKDGDTAYGTDIVSALRVAGAEGCLIMHTGNNTAEDIAGYLSHGADGVIGKGHPAPFKEALALYRKALCQRPTNPENG